MKIIVFENNIEKALAVLKKKLQREGVFRQLKTLRHFEKPSERKAREKAESIRHCRKNLAKKKAKEL